MSSGSFLCNNCSASIRYSAEQVGRRAKCPRCKNDIVVPAQEQVVDADPPKVVNQEQDNLCSGCGKRLKPGITRCKRC